MNMIVAICFFFCHMFNGSDDDLCHEWAKYTIKDVEEQQQEMKNSNYGDFEATLRDLTEIRCELISILLKAHPGILQNGFVIETTTGTDPQKELALAIDVSDSCNVRLYGFVKFNGDWKESKVLNMLKIKYIEGLAQIRVAQFNGMNMDDVIVSAFKGSHITDSKYLIQGTLAPDTWVGEVIHSYKHSE